MRSTTPDRPLRRRRVVGAFLAAALLALALADLEVHGHDPWAELLRMGSGFLRPDFGRIEDAVHALALTVAFAVAGVAAGGAAGLVLAPFYGYGPVRAACVAVRSVHELFWALMLMQVAGIGTTTGVLAIALPYAGIFAKVFHEYLEEADPRPARVLGRGADPLSRFLYARAPLASREMRTYALYRLECGLRSSAVLGFVGLPTLGFQLETFFRQGIYGGAAAILLLLVATIATVRLWMRRRLVLAWIAASAALLATVDSPPMGSGALLRFLTEDIVPAPLRRGDPGEAATWMDLGRWLVDIGSTALPALVATLVVAQLALVLAGLVAVAGFPLIVPRAVGRAGALAGHLLLVVLRSLPEYMLAYLFLQLLGPSMLPAVLALGLHNGAIVAHLLGRRGAAMVPKLRADAPRGVDLWAYELVPRQFGSFLALCLYRWEIIVRESAIVGLLGVATVGFLVDSAVAELRLDRAIVLLAATGLVCAGIDAVSRRLRARLGPAEARAERTAAALRTA